MKILCICDWGNVRSVAMAQYVKELNGKYQDFSENQKNIKHEAIAIGDQIITNETKEMLIKWSDKVIDVRIYLPTDIWHNPRDPDLKQKVKEIWDNFNIK